jgi:CheY-like chemotaxis protein
VRTSAESLLVILNDILDFSKIEAGKMELESIPFELGELLEEVCSVLSFKAEEKGVELSAELAPNTPRAFLGDPGRLRQILLNLCGNALKFTEQGRVDVRVASLSTDRENSKLRISVSDTGIGIPPAKLPNLFQPFIQADSSTTRKYGGTGLGLAICRQLVELMGGTIGVESQANEGSTFWFEICLPREGAGDSTHPGDLFRETSRPQRFEGRVLVAEDNTVNQIVARAILQHLGLDVRLANNGEEALHLLAEEAFDLVLMDMQMPVMDGLEAVLRWRAQSPGATSREVPIVALTANARKEDRDSCLEAGMVDFLSKPFSEHELRELLWRWMPRR